MRSRICAIASCFCCDRDKSEGGGGVCGRFVVMGRRHCRLTRGFSFFLFRHVRAAVHYQAVRTLPPYLFINLPPHAHTATSAPFALFLCTYTPLASLSILLYVSWGGGGEGLVCVLLGNVLLVTPAHRRLRKCGCCFSKGGGEKGVMHAVAETKEFITYIWGRRGGEHIRERWVLYHRLFFWMRSKIGKKKVCLALDGFSAERRDEGI